MANLMKKKFRIGGMTCVNCQTKIERKIRNKAGVVRISVSYTTGLAEITFDPSVISFEEVVDSIERLDYTVLPETQSEPQNISRTVCLLIIILVLYIVLQELGILNLLVPSRLADSGMGYGMLFIVGLLTSVHCIAMCGGINLSQCIPKAPAESGNDGFSAYLPAFLYNIGRVLSYTVIGFLLGLIGMLLGTGNEAGISALFQGILKLIAGIFMVIAGISMLGIFPWLRRFNLRMPRFPAEKLRKKKNRNRDRNSRPLLIGLLNGLMPCGPLQSMQIVALASGNPAVGALSMFFFSLGTLPLMLGLGTIVSALGKRFAQAVMSVGAVLVVVLGLAMLSQGGSLSGLFSPGSLLLAVLLLGAAGIVADIPLSGGKSRAFGIAAVFIAAVGLAVLWKSCGMMQSSENNLSGEDTAVQIVDGVQIVNSVLSAGQYPDITVLADIPVKWIIDAPEGSVNGCNYKMLIPSYGIEHSFQEGENIIEFTPTKTGDISYTCWMGMIRANIHVVDSTE